MCECGCGDFNAYENYRIGDRILSVEIYPGCEGCGTGIIVSINQFTRDEAEHWGVGDAPEFTVDQSGWGRVDFPLISKEDLEDWFEQNPELTEGYDTIQGFISDHGLEMLQGALHIRLGKIRQARGDEKK